jgi:proline iminopeptidase
VERQTLRLGAHILNIDGLDQRYHVHGRGPVCLVHPGGPGVHWESLRNVVLEQHLTMVYVEPLGTGVSGRLPSHPHGYTRALYARAIHRLIGHLDEQKVFLLGHSYGGFVAQRYALDHPERLAGLILYESAPVTGDEHIAEASAQVQQFVARNSGNPQLPAVLDALQKVSSCTEDNELNEALRGLLPAYFADYWGRETEFAAFREACTVTYISGLDAELNPEIIDDRAALATLPVPTLVLVGRHDVICGLRWAQELHELIPNSRLVRLEDSGHLGHVEQPEEFVSAVTTFTESLTGG